MESDKTKSSLPKGATVADEDHLFLRAAYEAAKDVLLKLFREDLTPEAVSRLSNTTDDVLPKDDCDTPFAVASASCAAWNVLKDFSHNASQAAIDPDLALLSLRQERYLALNGTKPNLWDEFSSVYESGNGDMVQLHCNFPNHRDAALKALDNPANLQEAKMRAKTKFQTGEELESAVLDFKGAAAMVRPLKHITSLSTLSPLVSISRIECPKSVPSKSVLQEQDAKPLRVIDLTRVLAGPVGTRVLREVTGNADVLTVTSSKLPQVEFARLLFSLGKRSAFCDFDDKQDLEAFHHLLGQSDIFVQSFRPSSLEKYGLGDDVCSRVPGLIKVNIRAYEGSDRRGYDSLMQCYTGMFAAHSSFVGRKEHLPVQALDHLTGVLACLGALVAVRRRSKFGGSYLVNVSLERTARLLIDELPMRGARTSLGGLERVESRALPKWLVTRKSQSLGGDMTFLKGVLSTGEDEDGQTEDFIAKAGVHPLHWLS